MGLQHLGKENIINELIQCIVDNVIDNETDNKLNEANNLLEELFIIAGGNINKPDKESILKVLKLLAARQLKKGKDISKISQHIKEITHSLN